MAPVSRPRTSSPQRFSASRHESSRATDSESTGVHGSGSIPSARNSGGRRQRPIWATAAFTPRLYFSSAARTSGRRRLPFLVGRTAQPQADEPLVDSERRRSKNLREPPARGASIELHLPQPLASVQESEGEPRIVDVAGVDVRHAVGVKQDLNWRRQAGQAQLPVQARDRPSQPEPGRPGKPNQDNRRQNEQPKGPPAAGGTCNASRGSVEAEESSACRLENRSHRIGCWRGHLTPGSCASHLRLEGLEVTPAPSVCCLLMPVSVIKWSTHCDRG